jgi:tetratricopeptide (TPR) repeat protein
VEIARTREIANWVAPFFPQCVGALALRKGDWEEAAEQLRQAAELAAEGNREALEEAQTALAQLEILQGKPREARDCLEGLIEEEGADLPLLLPVLAWAHLELGETERGLELAEQGEREVRKRQTLLCLPEVLRIKGIALSRLGRREGARNALVEGRERAAAMPNPYTEARILVELGLLDQLDGKADQAKERLREALTIFQQLGASKDIERSEQALAELDRSTQLTQ